MMTTMNSLSGSGVALRGRSCVGLLGRCGVVVGLVGLCGASAGISAGLAEGEGADGLADTPACSAPTWRWPELAAGSPWVHGAGPSAVVCDGSPVQVDAGHPLAHERGEIVQAVCRRYDLRPGQTFLHVPIGVRPEMLEYLPLVGELPNGNHCLISGGVGAYAGADVESSGGFGMFGLGKPCVDAAAAVEAE